ncbi:MAG TPA: hypothetical protein VM077_05995 [Candidatus Limnocylindrales bacterium]|nr:hypothetical protein [Candidatus Limnocylindrales bacterium]
MRIAEVNLIVHPDYDALYNGDTSATLHPLQKGLRAAWSQRTSEIALRENSLLIYVSALQAKDLRKPRSYLKGIKKDDVSRISDWRKMLGDRLIVFPKEPSVTRTVLADTFNQRGYSLDQENAILVAYGEYEELCVKGESELFQDSLGIPDSRTFIDRRQSLAYCDYDAEAQMISPRRQKEYV